MVDEVNNKIPFAPVMTGFTREMIDYQPLAQIRQENGKNFVATTYIQAPEGWKIEVLFMSLNATTNSTNYVWIGKDSLGDTGKIFESINSGSLSASYLEGELVTAKGGYIVFINESSNTITYNIVYRYIR